MLLPHLLALTLALAPSLASAAIFPKDTLVKMLDPKSFKRVMKKNQTSVVAFVAPWCGHCKNMAPEYSKAALGLHPLVPLYAVDCDAENNKRLCGEQGVQGFPTVKLFPRGNQKPAVEYNSNERTATAFFYWASRLVPNNVNKIKEADDITGWANKKVSKPRALLLHKDKKVPLLWQVLSNKYGQDIQLGSHHDRKGKTSVSMGFKAGGKKSSKVVIYPVDSTAPVLYEGLNKFDALSKFFDSVLDGTANLKVANEEAKAEEFVASKEDIETHEAQPGSSPDFVDVDDAIKEGHDTTDGTNEEEANEEAKAEEFVASNEDIETQQHEAQPGGSPDFVDVDDAIKHDTKDGTKEEKASQEKMGSEPEEIIVPSKGEDKQVVLEASVLEPEETKGAAAASPPAEPVEVHPKDEL